MKVRNLVSVELCICKGRTAHPDPLSIVLDRKLLRTVSLEHSLNQVECYLDEDEGSDPFAHWPPNRADCADESAGVWVVCTQRHQYYHRTEASEDIELKAQIGLHA